MMAAPEVLALNSLLIKVSGAKVVLDVGVFTGEAPDHAGGGAGLTVITPGASSLTAALAVGEGGQVLALERSKTYGQIAR